MNQLASRSRKEIFDYTLNNINKKYFGTEALKDINISFRKGEIHGIIGKNGAGKSTLVNIMYGVIQPTSGERYIYGEKVDKLTPEIAHRYNISMVPQKVNYALDITVADTLFIGNIERSRTGFININRMYLKTREILKKIGLEVEPNILIRGLNLETRRLIEIAKSLWVLNSQVIILDETTTALSIKSKNRLFEILTKTSREEEKTIIFISHRLEEVMEICDRVTVLRDGRTINTFDKKATSEIELSKNIIGLNNLANDDKKKTTTSYKRTSKEKSRKFLEIKNLTIDEYVKNINIEADIGEIIGLAGMVGSGASELLRYIGGVINANQTGYININGKNIIPRTPEQMIKLGVGYLTNNREEEGLYNTTDVESNIIGSFYKKYSNNIGLIKNKKINGVIGIRRKQLDIKMNSQKDSIDSLSGGNKQKIVVSRLLNYNLKIYLFDELTEGIDVEARGLLLNFVRENISKDSLIILYSNVVEDLIKVCNKVFTIYKGEINNMFDENELDEHKIYTSLQGINKLK